MQENRFTRLYIGVTLNKESLNDWNDYPSEVRLLWDDSTNLVKTFDPEIVMPKEFRQENDSVTYFPRYYEVPSELPPSSVKGYIRRDRIRRLHANIPSQIAEELENSGLKFPIFHAVRDANGIPKEAPALILTCTPTTREVKMNGKNSPQFSMMLRKYNNNNDLNAPRVRFNGYMMSIDVEWNLVYKQGQDSMEEIYSATYSPEPETRFLSRSKLSSQYTEMIGKTLDQFKGELAKSTVFDLSSKK